LFSLAVVRDGERYLLVEELDGDGNKVWYLPAGGVKWGEDMLAAAIRETREEAGIDIEIVGLLGGDQVVAQDGVATKVRMVFLGNMVGGHLKSKADKESLRAVWFHHSEIPVLPLRHAEVNDWIQTAERLGDCPLPQFTFYTSTTLQRIAGAKPGEQRK
jgi:ADP-ribose pyrophosphatase YjhB (NUDIX family)